MDLILQWSKLTPLDKSEIEQLASTGAVFRISKKQLDGKYFVCFVGSTADIKAELLDIISEVPTNSEHIILNILKGRGTSFSFRYAPVADEAMRRGIEKQMYRHYAPEYNLNEPMSTLDLKLNLN